MSIVPVRSVMANSCKNICVHRALLDRKAIQATRVHLDWLVYLEREDFQVEKARKVGVEILVPQGHRVRRESKAREGSRASEGQ